MGFSLRLTSSSTVATCGSEAPRAAHDGPAAHSSLPPIRAGLIVLVLAAASGSFQKAYAWGQEGHSIVAEIAQRRLSPEATANVARLIGSGASLASVASWADDVRGARPETYNWHFVDIAKADAIYVEERDCKASAKGDCVVKALNRLKREVRCGANDAAKAEALKFAVHFIGDIHQPLHAVGDLLGGNGVPISGSIHGKICKGACDIKSEASNLHSLWDSGLIRRTVYDWGDYVARLEGGWLLTEKGWQITVPESVEDWADQSHAIGQLVWSPSLVPADGVLDDKYYAAALPILDQQLALAGVRLARFLNEAFGSQQCTGADIAPKFPSTESGLGRFANAGEAKLAAIAYHDAKLADGRTQYESDQATVSDAAINYIASRATVVTRPAIVLDIDETSLDNWVQLRANDFAYLPAVPCDLQKKGTGCGSGAWEADGKAPAVSSTLRLFRAAKQAGVAIFFITGRGEDAQKRAATERNLRDAGFDGWTALIMRPSGVRAPSAASYKAIERARLALQGYSVIANIGDQPSDLSGGYAETPFLMPNPFYRIQ